MRGHEGFLQGRESETPDCTPNEYRRPAGLGRGGGAAASVGRAFAGVQWGRGEVRGQSSETEGEVEEGEIPSFNKLRAGSDAGMTGMCSVGRGDVFTFRLDVFSFGPEIAECVQFCRRCVQCLGSRRAGRQVSTRVGTMCPLLGWRCPVFAGMCQPNGRMCPVFG